MKCEPARRGRVGVVRPHRGDRSIVRSGPAHSQDHSGHMGLARQDGGRRPTPLIRPRWPRAVRLLKLHREGLNGRCHLNIEGHYRPGEEPVYAAWTEWQSEHRLWRGADEIGGH